MTDCRLPAALLAVFLPLWACGQETNGGGSGEAAADTTVESYSGTFRSLSGSHVRGKVTIRRVGERLSVRIEARGLPRGEVGQQLHSGAACGEWSAVAWHLDRPLGDAGTQLGGPYPVVQTKGGRLAYDREAKAPGIRDLDLANATVVLHDGSPGLPVACAELRSTPSSAGSEPFL